MNCVDDTVGQYVHLGPVGLQNVSSCSRAGTLLRKVFQPKCSTGHWQNEACKLADLMKKKVSMETSPHRMNWNQKSEERPNTRVRLPGNQQVCQVAKEP